VYRGSSGNSKKPVIALPHRETAKNKKQKSTIMKRHYTLDKSRLSPVPKTNPKDKAKKRHFIVEAKEGEFALGSSDRAKR
jgi:hypothetical protein